MKSKIPCPPGSIPVMKLDHATGLCGGRLVRSRRKSPSFRNLWKEGSFPCSMKSCKTAGSIPSKPSMMIFRRVCLHPEFRILDLQPAISGGTEPTAAPSFSNSRRVKCLIRPLLPMGYIASRPLPKLRVRTQNRTMVRAYSPCSPSFTDSPGFALGWYGTRLRRDRGPKARPIPAWGEAPGFGQKLKQGL